MPVLQPVRGTQDLLPAESRRHRFVADTARTIAARYGYAEIATPIFEFTDVFSRPIGEATDIVQKEMYSFRDRGGDELTLRPEYTAGIVRAVISNGLTQSLPLKLFASGPMFRYERPQKGRFRQFHQIDVELIGVAQPLGDIEVIALGAEILDALGVLARTELEINTLGDTASRTAYRAALVDYYRGHVTELSEDSRDRLERNPLRILDSKDARDKRHQRPGAVLRRVSHARGARVLRRRAGRPRSARHRLSPQPASGARARLLLPHRLRVRDPGLGRARNGAGRRPL